jgi:hypothetical protein
MYMATTDTLKSYVFQAAALDGQLAGLQKEVTGHKQAALCQENSLLALQTALATAEKKAALQVVLLRIRYLKITRRKEQCFGSGSSILSECGSGSRVLITQIEDEKIQQKFFSLFFHQELQYSYP